jgi:hypothetical protein
MMRSSRALYEPREAFRADAPPGLFYSRHGDWFHDGDWVGHAGLSALLCRSVARAEPSLEAPEGALIVTTGRDVLPFLSEDAPLHAHEVLIDELGLRRVDLDTSLPSMGTAWSISGMISIFSELGDAWPGCADVLTPEMRFGLETAPQRYGIEARAKIEHRRMELNDRMAQVFDPVNGVDFVITASNPDVAFNAEGPLPDTFGGVTAGAGNNGRLTFPANLHGNAAISIPAGTLDGLPIGLQVVGRHYSEPLLLDIALTMERTRPWALVAPGAPV